MIWTNICLRLLCGWDVEVEGFNLQTFERCSQTTKIKANLVCQLTAKRPLQQQISEKNPKMPAKEQFRGLLLLASGPQRHQRLYNHTIPRLFMHYTGRYGNIGCPIGMPHATVSDRQRQVQKTSSSKRDTEGKRTGRVNKEEGQERGREQNSDLERVILSEMDGRSPILRTCVFPCLSWRHPQRGIESRPHAPIRLNRRRS